MALERPDVRPRFCKKVFNNSTHNNRSESLLHKRTSSYHFRKQSYRFRNNSGTKEAQNCFLSQSMNSRSRNSKRSASAGLSSSHSNIHSSCTKSGNSKANSKYHHGSSHKPTNSSSRTSRPSGYHAKITNQAFSKSSSHALSKAFQHSVSNAHIIRNVHVQSLVHNQSYNDNMDMRTGLCQVKNAIDSASVRRRVSITSGTNVNKSIDTYSGGKRYKLNHKLNHVSSNKKQHDYMNMTNGFVNCCTEEEVCNAKDTQNTCDMKHSCSDIIVNNDESRKLPASRVSNCKSVPVTRRRRRRSLVIEINVNDEHERTLNGDASNKTSITQCSETDEKDLVDGICKIDKSSHGNYLNEHHSVYEQFGEVKNEQFRTTKKSGEMSLELLNSEKLFKTIPPENSGKVKPTGKLGDYNLNVLHHVENNNESNLLHSGLSDVKNVAQVTEVLSEVSIVSKSIQTSSSNSTIKRLRERYKTKVSNVRKKKIISQMKHAKFKIDKLPRSKSSGRVTTQGGNVSKSNAMLSSNGHTKSIDSSKMRKSLQNFTYLKKFPPKPNRLNSTSKSSARSEKSNQLSQYTSVSQRRKQNSNVKIVNNSKIDSQPRKSLKPNKVIGNNKIKLKAGQVSSSLKLNAAFKGIQTKTFYKKSAKNQLKCMEDKNKVCSKKCVNKSESTIVKHHQKLSSYKKAVTNTAKKSSIPTTKAKKSCETTGSSSIKKSTLVLSPVQNKLLKLVTLKNCVNSKEIIKKPLIQNKSKKTFTKIIKSSMHTTQSSLPTAKKSVPKIQVISNVSLKNSKELTIPIRKKKRKHFRGGRYKLGVNGPPKKKRKIIKAGSQSSPYSDIAENLTCNLISNMSCDINGNLEVSRVFSDNSPILENKSQLNGMMENGDDKCRVVQNSIKNSVASTNYNFSNEMSSALRQVAKKTFNKPSSIQPADDKAKDSVTSHKQGKLEKNVAQLESGYSDILSICDFLHLCKDDLNFLPPSDADCKKFLKLNLVNGSCLPHVSTPQVSSEEMQGLCASADDAVSSSKKLCRKHMAKSLSKKCLWNLRQPESFFNQKLRSGDLPNILSILGNGVNPNHKFKNDKNNTPLHIAASLGLLSVVQLLIQVGADIESINNDLRTALMLALEKKHFQVVQYLLMAGAEVSNRDENGMLPFHIAAQAGDISIMKMLFGAGFIDVNIQDDGGWTPLVWACEHKHHEVVKWLLDIGADPNIRDKELNIALHWAAFSGCEKSAAAVLEKGSNVNAVNKVKDSPLHIASRKNHYKCVLLFVSHGAKTNIRNNADLIPLLCCTNYTSDTWKFLQSCEIKNMTEDESDMRDFVVFGDISGGKERHPIEVVNKVDHEQFVPDFCYTTELCESANVNINRIVKTMTSCRCQGICNKSKCSCSMLSFRLWYSKSCCLVPDFDMLHPPVIFECNKMCSCSQNCLNRVVQHGIRCHLQLFRTEGRGWGVRTLQDVQRGSFICEYLGELLTDAEAEAREDDSYLMELVNEDEASYCIDAKSYGNISRFINHSCSPNVTAVKVFIDHQDLNFPHIAFFSNRDIKAKEELCFDYGDKFWQVKSRFFLCLCGSSACKYSATTINSTFKNCYDKLGKKITESSCGS